MSDSHTDHDDLIMVLEQVRQHTATLTSLDLQGREHALGLARMGEHVSALQASHTLIVGALDTIQRQQASDKEHTAEHLSALDRKIADGNVGLRDHFDEKIDGLRDDVTQGLTREREALPQWAKVRMMKVSVVVAILAVAISVAETFHWL